MRVLITSPIFPPDLGGPSTYVPSIGRFLVERGHEVKVVAFCSDPNPSGYPFPVVSIPRGPLPVRYLKAFWRVLREVKGFDVVYVQEHLALLHVLAAKLRGVPVVIRIMVDGSWEIAHRKGWIGDDTITDYQGKDYGDWRVNLTRYLQRKWWGWCTRIISCSDFLRNILVETYGVPGDKVRRIFNAYHGPDPDSVSESRDEARAKLGLDPAKRYLLSINRLMGWKRVDGVIEALSELPEDVELVVCGDGDMEEAWKALAAERGLAARVHFLGNVPHAKIPLYIRAADVFVLNSLYEGLSHTLLEVQALGTPIVASRVCGNPEVVVDGESGLLVEPRDSRELAEAVRKLLSDSVLRARFSAAGLAQRPRFLREETFAEVQSVLEAAAGFPR
ncbi:MAG: glycosyltransferase family 4 protein [Planctomycetes bacterium]|nr:glycosyltransferase family 4 protein [Planctomycetota bacterium]MCB9905171.1 glycosyltransferase family 4 protein [Planctomycetota bacterium]